MVFPLSLILVAYVIGVGAVLLYSLFNLYHLLRYGTPSGLMLVLSAGYLAVLLVILLASWLLLAPIDWRSGVEFLSGPLPFTQGPTPTDEY